VKVAYLFSRYPAVSHTFCDTEMLAHEQAGLDMEIDVIHPPLTSFRHGHAAQLRAPIFYAPPGPVLKAFEQLARQQGRFPEALVREHEERYGLAFKPAERARNALHFADGLTRRGVNHLHVHFANRAAYTALFISTLSGIPFSFTAHGQDFMTDLGSRELLDEMCRRAAFVVAVSDYSRDLLARTCPAAEAKIYRIHNGMELRNFPLAPAPIHGAPRILSVGRLIPAKGHEHLIAACARLRDQGLVFECDIVGDGPLRDSLQAAIDAAQLGSTVRLTGSLPQEEVFRRLTDASIFALASVVDAQGTTDILPTVILEAMASARPVVATRVGGVAELVDDARTGFLVAPTDVTGLAEALAKLLADDTLRADFGAAGRAKVESEFRVKKSAAALRELFTQRARPSAPPGKLPSASPAFAYLVARWPEPTLPDLARELNAMITVHPGMRVIVCRVASNANLTAEDAPLLEAMDFLPDGMVLEAEWQQERGLARQIEGWRNQLSIEADEFLQQGRWALHLRRLITNANLRHLHVAGSRALPCGWILQQLCGLTLSATIEQPPARSGALLQELTIACRGGRASRPALRQALGTNFERDFPARRLRFWPANGDDRPLHAWGEKLQRWSTGSEA
jgi:glycosyltransferase involved in cell wall biosynthesis